MEQPVTRQPLPALTRPAAALLGSRSLLLEAMAAEVRRGMAGVRHP